VVHKAGCSRFTPNLGKIQNTLGTAKAALEGVVDFAKKEEAEMAVRAFLRI